MSTYLLERPLRVADPGARGWGLLLIVAAWSALAANTAFGFVSLTIPRLLLIVFAVPIVLVGAALFHRGGEDRALQLAAAWSALLLAALFAGVLVDVEPVIALVVPAVVVSAVVCARRPAAAVITAFFVTGSFGTLEALTPVPAGETVDMVLAGLWGGVLWGYLFGRRERPSWVWPGIALAVVYVVVTAVAVVWAEPVFGGLFGFRASAWYMAAFLLLAYARWDAPTHKRIATGFVGVAALVGGYATFRWIAGPAGAEEDLALSVNPEYQYLYGELVVFGSFPGGKNLAAWTAVAIPFCVAFALTFRDRWRFVAAVAAGLCAVGLLGSEARAGFVGAVAGIALVLVLYQLSKGVPGLHLGVTAAAVAVIVGVGALVFTQKDEGSLERYTVLVEDPTSVPSYQARLFKWNNALDDIDRHPLGHGIGTSGIAEQRYRRFTTIASSNLDNSYLKVAYEQGLFVLVLFALAVVGLLTGLVRRSIFATDRQRAGLAIGGAGAMAALGIIMFSGMYVEGLTALAAWMLVGLGVAQFTSTPEDAPDAAPAR
ncbi:MAG: O-antigen ligase family protein [Thermoleophilaceae bacterium]